MKKAKITINPEFTIGVTDKRLFGSFLEHLGRAIYTGVYQPDSPLADEDGFRSDVIDLVRELNVPVVRYPGGNFVSGYDWTDGIGPKDKRPVRPENAWQSIETNQFGTDEFIKWCKKANTEPLLAINLGTKGITEAGNIVEYCNLQAGTYWSDMRVQNGSKNPHNVKLWCLGNEMDGPWQMGHMDAHDYGLKANSASRLMKMLDPTIETVLCGSSNRGMKTFCEWEATALDLAFDSVDYISLHTYFDNRDKNLKNFLAKSVGMESYIEEVISTCDYVKAKKRSKKKMMLSFDEWNVWYHSSGHNRGGWTEAPHILEDVYDFADVLVVGLMLNTLLRHCDRVKIACLAQLVNVIAPIMTDDNSAWKQTIFLPFKFASNYGRGTVLNTLVETGKYDSKDFSDVPDTDIVSVLSDDGEYLTVFAINRDTENDYLLEIRPEFDKSLSPVEFIAIDGFDIDAINTAEKQTVREHNKELPVFEDKKYKAAVAPLSWNMLRFKVK